MTVIGAFITHDFTTLTFPASVNGSHLTAASNLMDREQMSVM